MRNSFEIYRTWLIALALVILLSAWTFGYRTTLSEPDMVRVLAGFIYGTTTGSGISAGQSYGIAFSFGYYQLIYSILPAHVFANADALAFALNVVSWPFASIFIVSLAAVSRELICEKSAAFSTIVFALSPVSLPFMISGHPMVFACAFMFTGIYFLLVAGRTLNRIAFSAYVATALVLLTMALCMRGETLLAFPFIAMASVSSNRRGEVLAIRRTAFVFVALAISIAVFFYLQQPFVEKEGGPSGTLARFLEKFVSFDRVGRGLVVMILGLGIGTTFLFSGLLFLRGRIIFRGQTRLFICISAMIVPSLLFWIPNSQPARHLILPILGVCILCGLLISAYLRNLKTTIIWAVLLSGANQALAEIVRPFIVAKYQWTYENRVQRRATQQLPLGFFPLDQRANIEGEAILRDEAVALAARDPDRLIVMADSQHYMIGRLLLLHPSMRISKAKIGEFDALLLADRSRQIYFVPKADNWPKDTLKEILQVTGVAEFPIYVQRATISRHDKVPVPDSRRFTLALTGRAD
jgi:hypothetical protein